MNTMNYVGSTEIEMDTIDISQSFDGARHRSRRLGVTYQNPRDLQGGPRHSEFYHHRDILRRHLWRPRDLQRYIDPADGKPRRLLVQATPQVLVDGSGDWRRIKVNGNAPVMLRLSNWVLKSMFPKRKGQKVTAQEIAILVGKVLVACPLLTFLVMTPMHSEVKISPFYAGVPIVSWEYPRYARNDFDAAPRAVAARRKGQDTSGTRDQGVFDASSQHIRRLKPAYLVVHRGKGWGYEENVDDLPYLMFSFTRAHFNEESQELHNCAAKLTIEAGLSAYWVDFCIQRDESQSVTSGIHTICDIVRGARQIIVVVKDTKSTSRAEWGRRMWTLPEVLLSSNELIKFASVKGPVEERSRISLATEVWQDDQEARLLAEHFSGKLTLSRLELISVALRALGMRDTNAHFQGDLAYCLMGLLGHRPTANPSDNLFQALARLSLANDSDRIVERMMCMLSKVPAERDINREFLLDDWYGSKLWEIEPLCQVAGVCEGRAVILDGCRGASIQWAKIPTIAYARRRTTERKFTETVLRSGPVPLLIGIIIALVTTGGTKAFGIILLLLGISLILASPWTIMNVYGGKVWGAVPHLIGFEGTLPIREIESTTFGNAIGRLRYAPSSSLLAVRSEHERIGEEPEWITDRSRLPHGSVLEGQRLFTLIDTGSMTVSVFAAKTPPSVALVVGREGGMLRVVLCSYEWTTATLVKETVLRMETPMLEKALLLGWVKLQSA